jgi:hypothetical protein
MTTEILGWKPVASPLDSNSTVLLFDPATSEPVWLGYLDCNTWRFIDGMSAALTHYCDIPQGPSP